jgi:hypothetical protein
VGFLVPPHVLQRFVVVVDIEKSTKSVIVFWGIKEIK